MSNGLDARFERSEGLAFMSREDERKYDCNQNVSESILRDINRQKI